MPLLTGRPVRARRKPVGLSPPTVLNPHPGMTLPGRPRPKPPGPAKGNYPGVAPPPAPTAAVAQPAPAVVAPVAPAASGIQYAAPQTTDSAALRAEAARSLGQANTTYRDDVFRAAMNLGDPTIMAKLAADPQFAGYNFSSVDPNSLLQQLQRSETQGLTNVDQASNANNAFFSGFRLQDRNKLSDDIQRQRLGGVTSYEDNLKDYAAALSGAQGQYNMDIGHAGQMEADAAAATEPTASVTGSRFVPLPTRSAPKSTAKDWPLPTTSKKAKKKKF